VEDGKGIGIGDKVIAIHVVSSGPPLQVRRLLLEGKGVWPVSCEMRPTIDEPDGIEELTAVLIKEYLLSDSFFESSQCRCAAPPEQSYWPHGSSLRLRCPP